MYKAVFRVFATLMITVGLSGHASGQAFTENFDDFWQLVGDGWFTQNNSNPLGSNTWFQGTATTAQPDPGPFNAYNGVDNAYVGVNFNSTSGAGTISNWLGTPNRTFRNGDVLTFFTRKPTILPGMTDYPDRLEVRLSTNGASTNVGMGAAAVGDFTTLLLSINPTLIANVYPQVWTMYTITVAGLPAPTSGRLAFRYFVTNAGPLGASSDYIGIDNVVYTPYVCPALTMTAGGALAAGTLLQPYTRALIQTGALGAPSFAITAGALPPGLTLSLAGVISGTPSAMGTFNFTATVSDASGCSGSQSYSITVLPDVPGAPQSVNATPGNMQAEVSWQAPVDDGGATILGYTATAVQDPTRWCSTTGALSCTVTGLSNGTGYTFSVVANNSEGASPAGVSGMVTPTLATISGAVPGMSGTATATITAGGPTCTFDPISAFVVPVTSPNNRTVPYGGFEFLAIGCVGSVTVAITYPDPLPSGIQYWKFGPASAGAPTSTWFPWSGSTLSLDRRTVTYTVIDNGVGDSDNVLGRIRDPFALALGGGGDHVGIPVDNPWALVALATALAGLGMHRQRRRASK